MPMKGKMSWAPGKSLAGAFHRLERQVQPDIGKVRAALVPKVKALRQDMAGQIASEIGMGKAGAKRRLRFVKSRPSTERRSGVAFVAIRTYHDASIVHAGRLKGLRVSRAKQGPSFRGGKGVKVPGVPTTKPPFLLAPHLYKGKERRVYQRVGAGRAGLKAVNHPTTLVKFYAQNEGKARAIIASVAPLVYQVRRSRGRAFGVADGGISAGLRIR